MEKKNKYDAVMIVSFGGPEGMDDVRPFLENVLRGKNVPAARMEEVVHHYKHFDGVSPINAQNRELKILLEAELKAKGIEVPVYWGNRNWHPFLADTIQAMHDTGIRRCLNYMTSAYSSYSGCRQYREDIEKATQELGVEDMEFGKIRVFYNHPDWIELNRFRVSEALKQIPEARRSQARIVFTAHSIPTAMSDNCRYVAQLETAAQLVSEAVGHSAYALVYQSRSGPPNMPWLEPDVSDHLTELKAQGVEDVVVHPLGFVSDHLEVLFDLDVEAQEHCTEIGLNMVRSKSAGNHPVMISMIRELVEERLSDDVTERATGDLGPSHHICPTNCCKPMQRPR
jgi:protoporphyrin/coproporphyrin ferrochelatase